MSDLFTDSGVALDAEVVVRSVYENQDDLLRGIMALHKIERFDVDLTYGNGGFYKNFPHPVHKFDIEPLSTGVVKADSAHVPLPDDSVESVMFDPPFMTYVRAGREGNGSMRMAQRFGGYWTYGELTEHYTGTLDEAARILRPRGLLVFKCQDIVHNHRLHATHVNVVQWAQDRGFRLKDFFILAANHRLPRPNRRGPQQHARIFHSYFLVLERGR